jgi:hypothetical protein
MLFLSKPSLALGLIVSTTALRRYFSRDPFDRLDGGGFGGTAMGTHEGIAVEI